MICPLLRGSTRLASLFLGLLLSAASLPAQTPQGRILNTFDGTLDHHEPFLETETMIVSAKTYYRTDWGEEGEEWQKVRFWDKDGSNYSERVIPKGLGAGTSSMRCIAQGNDLFLPSGGSYHVVNRDPSVPVRWVGYIEANLCEVTDQYLIVRTLYAQDWDGIKFHDRQTFQQVGRVETTLRVQQLVARDNDIVFTSRDAKGRFRIHRMGYPDFSTSDVVKMKITALPGTYDNVVFFGKNFAVVSGKGKESVIRYSDPAKKGKTGVYPLEDTATYGEWLECDGTLARWVPHPVPGLWRFEFADNGYTLQPVGLPAGFLGSHYLSAGDNSIYVSGPTSYVGYLKPGDWVHRLDFSPGRQLLLDNPVADERDGALRFTARLDQPATQAVTFSYETAGGSAVSGTDFTAVPGTATIAVGQSEAHIEVPLTEDLTIERPESLELRITALQGALCDSTTVVGRIRGSGARLLEEVADDTGGFVVGTLDTTATRENSVRSFTIGDHTVEARKLGFDGFWPVADGGDGFRYARAVPLGSDRMKFCQFDGTTGDLLEVFDHAPFNCQGGELILGKGVGYIRYGFYDGFPVISLDGIAPVEGAGEQVFTVKSERTTRLLHFEAEWSDPAQAAGDVSFVGLSSGDIAFHITPDDDQTADLGVPRGIAIGLLDVADLSFSAMTANVLMQDNDVVHTTFVPTETFQAKSLAASGNRVWLARTNGSKVEAFDFAGGMLKPGPKVAMPKGVSLRSNNHHYSYGAGQALAFDGSRLLACADKVTGSGILTFTGAGGSKPKGKFLTTQLMGTSQVAAPGFTITSNAIPLAGTYCVVQVRDLKNKLVTELKPGNLQGPSFGYSMAVSGNILWIASPRIGGLGGRVDGYLLGSFAPFTTLISPDPVAGGTFGYSIAAHGPYLVIGEPSNSAPGAAWVYSADGSTMHKRLGSGALAGIDGFGTQVATRNGRILIGAGVVEGNFGTTGTPPPAHRPVLLWSDLNENPLRLVPSTADEPGFESGFRIALLDGCAVMAAGSETEGGLEYYAFPEATSESSPAKRSSVAGTATWPAGGAPDPVWSFANTAGGEIEVVVNLGGIPANPGDLVMEWSADLVHWAPLADAAGTTLSAAKVTAVAAGGGILKVTFQSEPAGKGFFRLKSAD